MNIGQSLYLPSVEIKGFKSIENLTVGSFASMNLLTGDNNVGKSTLLEALFVYLSGGTTESILRVASDRMNLPEYVRLGDDPSYFRSMWASLFTDWILVPGKKIVISSPQNTLEIRFVNYYEEEVRSGEERLLRTKIIECENERAELSHIDLHEGLRIEYEGGENMVSLTRLSKSLRTKGKETGNIQFIRTSSFSNEANARLWDNITLTDQEKDVINALKVIEPDIKGIAFLEEPIKMSIGGRRRVPYITYHSKQGRYPLSMMGDGMNRILSLILSLVNSGNGVCLIDEVENGIYYHRQPALWEVIASLVENLNIQLFATTHSGDCVKSFANVATAGNAKLIRLEKREKGIKTVDYTAEEVGIAADHDIEIR